MTDKVIVRIPQERAELLSEQFRAHNAIDGNVFLMCVCEDCALFRTWHVTTMVGQQATMSILTAGMVRGMQMLQLLDDDDDDDAESEQRSDADCGHCVHWHEAKQGFAPTSMRPVKVACCHCGSVVEVT